MSCAVEAGRIWSRETVIVAIQAWARESGGIPPAATDWNPNQARKIGHPEKAERFLTDNAWPYVTTVRDLFGRWNAAVEAAGFSPRGPGKYGREGEDDELCEEIAKRYEAGERPCDLAEEYGCSRSAILGRAVKAGARIRTRSEAQVVRWGKVAA